jgi:hypothetical protein
MPTENMSDEQLGARRLVAVAVGSELRLFAQTIVCQALGSGYVCVRVAEGSRRLSSVY